MRTVFPLVVFLMCANAGQALEPVYQGAAPEEVKTEDGRSFLGMVTAKDDYTLVIESVAGLANVPIAALQGESWKKYSKDKERKQDGRFWTERKEALTLKWEKGDKTTPLEKLLEEVTPYAGIIAAYKASQSGGKEEVSGQGARATAQSQGKKAETAPISLFSGPSGLGGGAGVPNLPTQAPTLPSVPSLP